MKTSGRSGRNTSIRSLGALTCRTTSTPVSRNSDSIMGGSPSSSEMSRIWMSRKFDGLVDFDSSISSSRSSKHHGAEAGPSEEPAADLLRIAYAPPSWLSATKWFTS
jgi:hypothetical protein